MTGSVARASCDTTASLQQRQQGEALRMCAGVQGLSPISEKVTLTAAFSNAHDVYSFFGIISRSLRPKRWAMRICVSQDLRFCGVVDGDVCGGSWLQTVRSQWRLLRFGIMPSGRRPCGDARQGLSLVPVVMQRQVWHYRWCGRRR